MNNQLKTLLCKQISSGSKQIQIMESEFYMDYQPYVRKYIPFPRQDEYLYRLATMTEESANLANGKGNFKTFKQNKEQFWNELNYFSKYHEEEN